jgi:hypothetical protein
MAVLASAETKGVPSHATKAAQEKDAEEMHHL